jgi:hypothetical protein
MQEESWKKIVNKLFLHCVNLKTLGSFGKDMRFHYCTMDPHGGHGKGNWPPGNYCILKHGPSCPKGQKHNFNFISEINTNF